MTLNRLKPYLNLFDEFLKAFVLLGAHLLHIRIVHRTILLTIRTNIFVDVFGFGLQNADTSAMEPVLTLVTANVKLRLIVWFPAYAVQLLGVARMLAFAANELGDFFRLFFGDIDTVAVEPIVAQVTAHIKPAYETDALSSNGN